MIKSKERVVREGNKEEEGEQGEVEKRWMKGRMMYLKSKENITVYNKSQ